MIVGAMTTRTPSAGSDDRPPPTETAAPARNFTITLADKVRAAGGPMAYMSRRRQIEDLDAALVQELLELLEDPKAFEATLGARRFAARVARLNKLIDAHNRYYPAEANLPLDPRSGEMLERGVPWRPLPSVSPEVLVARARAARAERT
jgi:hypothetical protein